AGAGSGMATVLVSRTGRLIQDKLTAPERICVLTFTNKAAQELKHRVATKLGKTANKVWAGTFHGFGLQFLKEHNVGAGLPQNFGVIDASDALAVLKDLVRDLHHFDKARLNMEQLMARISHLRAHGKADHFDDSPESEASVVLTPKFNSRLRTLGVVDFEDLLLRPLQLLRKNPDLK